MKLVHEIHLNADATIQEVRAALNALPGNSVFRYGTTIGVGFKLTFYSESEVPKVVEPPLSRTYQAWRPGEIVNE